MNKKAIVLLVLYTTKSCCSGACLAKICDACLLVSCVHVNKHFALISAIFVVD